MGLRDVVGVGPFGSFSWSCEASHVSVDINALCYRLRKVPNLSPKNNRPHVDSHAITRTLAFPNYPTGVHPDRAYGDMVCAARHARPRS